MFVTVCGILASIKELQPVNNEGEIVLIPNGKFMFTGTAEALTSRVDSELANRLMEAADSGVSFEDLNLGGYEDLVAASENLEGRISGLTTTRDDIAAAMDYYLANGTPQGFDENYVYNTQESLARAFLGYGQEAELTDDQQMALNAVLSSGAIAGSEDVGGFYYDRETLENSFSGNAWDDYINEAINTQVIYATSAGMKSSFAYEALIDFFEESIIDPKHTFTMGLDYRIPMLHGLIDAAHVRNLKMSPSYNEQTFASEYMGVWAGGSEESWFDFEKISKYRKIKNPEWKQKFRGDSSVFYLISVDVGRLSDQTVACIWRINVRDYKYYSTMVNIFVLGRQAETKTFVQQAIDLKKLIEDFNPREVVIDCNGLGIGLADEMIRTQMDDIGNTYPAYGFFNNDDYKKIQPKDAACILYSMKANGPLNSKIHSNAYTRLNSGMVRFLITEQEARSALLATQVGAKMPFEKRVKRLMPHELTTKLFEEMANLRLKRSGLDIVLEQINSRFPKDKYSAFAYGLWRIKEIEEETYQKHKRRGIIGQKKLTFYTEGA